ncbi:hypothetical protein GCM10028824_25640 [Hymenobacter segetis]
MLEEGLHFVAVQHTGAQAGKGLVSHRKKICGGAAVGGEAKVSKRAATRGSPTAKYGRRCLT